jgi:hypothetical protein
MKLHLDPGDREILRNGLGLAANASTSEIANTIRERLTGAAPQPERRTADAHDLIAAAVDDERIPARRAEFWAQRFADDPERTAKELASLTPVPSRLTAAAGGSGAYPASWLPEVHRERAANRSD